MPHHSAARIPNQRHQPSLPTRSLCQRRASDRKTHPLEVPVPTPTPRVPMDLTQVPLQSADPATIQAKPNTNSPPQYRIASPKPSDRGYQEIAALSSDTRQQVGRVKIKGSPEQETLTIASLWVDPQHRQRGVSKSLLDAATTAGQQRGYRQAQLGVDPEAPGMSTGTLEKIYRRQGFKKNGTFEQGNPLMDRRL